MHNLLHNLPYGPWDGSVWFNKLCEAARGLCSRDKHGGELFQRLLPGMCKDKGVSTTLSAEGVFRDLVKSPAFLTKGPRTAIRRWFSWMPAAQWFNRHWHSYLLVIIYIGIQLGVYRSHKDTPLWGGGDVLKEPAVASDEEDALPCSSRRSCR